MRRSNFHPGISRPSRDKRRGLLYYTSHRWTHYLKSATSQVNVQPRRHGAGLIGGGPKDTPHQSLSCADATTHTLVSLQHNSSDVTSICQSRWVRPPAILLHQQTGVGTTSLSSHSYTPRATSRVHQVTRPSGAEAGRFQTAVAMPSSLQEKGTAE